jgi:diaminopimelate epimerase
MRIWKAHAYGNDFLLMSAAEVAAQGHARAAWPLLARAVCARHTGIGADGLMLFRDEGEGGSEGVRMDLLNADGSYSELSGNGIRCLAALIVHQARAAGQTPDVVVIHTDAGVKTLTPVGYDAPTRRATFRAAMGRPERLREVTLDVAGERVRAAALTMGNPQCILLDQPMTEERLHKFGPALQQHPEFPDAVNVEIIQVDAPETVRILIWERGVGPTESSGTGSCASAVAAAAFAGAARSTEVIAPGGSQRVEWTADGEVYLTGWAQLVLEGEWMP